MQNDNNDNPVKSSDGNIVAGIFPHAPITGEPAPRYGDKRRCQRCGNFVSTYNQENMCWPCQERVKWVRR